MWIAPWSSCWMMVGRREPQHTACRASRCLAQTHQWYRRLLPRCVASVGGHRWLHFACQAALKPATVTVPKLVAPAGAGAVPALTAPVAFGLTPSLTTPLGVPVLSTPLVPTLGVPFAPLGAPSAAPFIGPGLAAPQALVTPLTVPSLVAAPAPALGSSVGPTGGPLGILRPGGDVARSPAGAGPSPAEVLAAPKPLAAPPGFPSKSHLLHATAATPPVCLSRCGGRRDLTAAPCRRGRLSLACWVSRATLRCRQTCENEQPTWSLVVAALHLPMCV